MNADVVFAYIALGAMAKLILMRNPSPGRRYATAAELIAGGLLCGWASSYLPYSMRMISIAFVAIPLGGGIFGQVTGDLIDRGRIWLYERKERNERSSKGERATSADFERRDRDVPGDCEAQDGLRTFSNGRIVREYRPAEIPQANEDSTTADD